MMPDKNRPRSAETKAASTSRGIEQEREKLVNVPRTLLENLKHLPDDLEVYIRCYSVSRELYELCETVRYQLQGGNQKPERLDDWMYWDNLRGWLVKMYEISADLPPLASEEFQKNLSDYEENLGKIQDLMGGPMRNPRGGERLQIVIDGLRINDDMKNDIYRILLESKRNADKVLDQIGKIIQSIFDRIEAAREQSVGEASEQKASYEGKPQEKSIGHKKEPTVYREGQTSYAAATGAADKRGR